MSVRPSGTRRSFPRAAVVVLSGILSLALSIAVPTAAPAALPQKPGVEGPLSPRLTQLAAKDLRSASNGEQAEALSLPARGAGSLLRRQGSVVVEVRTMGSTRSRVSGLEDAGAETLHVSPRYETITVAVAERELRALAEAPGVEAVTEVLEPMVAEAGKGTAAVVPPISTCAGSVTSEGDAQLKAAAARTQFNVDGSGVKVGVLSDSFDRDASASTQAANDIASGDLPGPGNPCGRTTPVEVIDDSELGNDEGRGMLQLVHDLAPGAPLAFATAASERDRVCRQHPRARRRGLECDRRRHYLLRRAAVPRRRHCSGHQRCNGLGCHVLLRRR